MSEQTAARRTAWAEAWPDALAFLGGLALAWFGEWETKDLVWSLWLSSLVVGYAMIAWNIFNGSGGNLITLAGGVFMLAFFTVHFGGFHFVHSVFLNTFFPISPSASPGLLNAGLYLEVFRNYWMFVVIAAIAERGAFKKTRFLAQHTAAEEKATDTSRSSRSGNAPDLMAPYKNVVRLHLLIFFFAFASFGKIDHFLVYAVVYAVYFFPWRLLKRETSAPTGA
ncbi:DUF6498-containing protein [Oleiharenicola lentus]|uniref:DUF6498-containing protein n=1 Tax=Oleiharenicola lentus TaxID=2508720 RepID=UPI003F66189A